jgi:hypothetical protein
MVVNMEEMAFTITIEPYKANDVEVLDLLTRIADYSGKFEYSIEDNLYRFLKQNEYIKTIDTTKSVPPGHLWCRTWTAEITFKGLWYRHLLHNKYMELFQNIDE